MKAHKLGILLALIVGMCLGCTRGPHSNGKSNRLSDEEARRLALDSIRKSLGSGEEKSVKAVRKEDLEHLLRSVEVSRSHLSSRVPFLYEMFIDSAVPATASTHWIVAVSPDSGITYSLLGNPEAPTQYNMLISEVRGIAITNNDQAQLIARLYLTLTAGEGFFVASNELQARHSVETFFYSQYGGGKEWEEAFHKWWSRLISSGLRGKLALHSQPLESGFQVSVHPILMITGQNPKVEEWELFVSFDGKVRVAQRRRIFE